MTRTALAALVVALLATGCSGESSSGTSTAASATATTASVNSTIVPAESWQISTPEEQGMSSGTLAGLFDEIVDQRYRIDSVLVVRNGRIVADAAVPGYEDDSLHIVHSVTKSIVSTLIGIAIEDGHLDGVDQPVLDIFADREIANVDARKERMTVEHLLTMTTGFDCRDSYLHSWEGLGDLRSSHDWIQHVLDLPMIAEPGEQFEYCNSASFLLSAIIQEVTGKTADEFAQDRLFGPIGVTGYHWPANPDGISIGWGELLIAPRDLARFGLLILDEGRWHGEQVVPEAWIYDATTPHIDGTLQNGYGYQWWIRDDGIIEALGYKGQYVIVDRRRNLVVVSVSDLPDEGFFIPDDLFDRHVIPSVVSDDPPPPDPAGRDAMADAVARWRP